jgi:hypothetical protein
MSTGSLFSRHAKELLNPGPDNALKNLFISGYTQNFCHHPIYIFLRMYTIEKIMAVISLNPEY